MDPAIPPEAGPIAEPRAVGSAGLAGEPSATGVGDPDPAVIRIGAPAAPAVLSPGLATPWAVRHASYLMWAGAALQAVAVVIALLTDNLMRAVLFGILSLFAVMFWRWTAQAARRADPGTRSTAVLLLAWATMYVMKWRSGWEPLPVMIVFALEWLAGLGATALLFGRGSTAYFRQYRADGRVLRWVRASLVRGRPRPAPGSGR